MKSDFCHQALGIYLRRLHHPWLSSVGEGEIVKKGSLTDLRFEMPSGDMHPLEKAFE